MTINISSSWWQKYHEVIHCSRLHHELLILVHDRQDTAQRLINLEKIKYPGQSESWYLDKVIYNLRRSA
jgi:hypothetical protein